ncbi:PREDICTED: uncharacterized protein LOC109341721 [Lupinus angustifolius]|uniref:uncharacterized protein LOC109341721 n=1 Tax=Lupinus angustifolius TaxID=3871 RepID=UPI00092E7974|nr:PREDICTED: uncharacterized protein LOC109341721 [Lupinus angustifolius]
MGNPKTRLVFKKLCSINKPDVVFISEPMVPLNKISSVYWSALKLKPFIENDRGSLLPNLWGACREGINPQIISNTAQQISISLMQHNKLAFICAVYAHTNYMMRRTLWTEIMSLISNNNGPWCCIGDFNSVLGANECKGSYLPNRLACDDFQRFSEDGRLHHILTRGAEFKWTNRRRGLAHTEKRLDRSLCNESWMTIWQQSYCCTLPRSASDHHPIMFGFCNEQARVQSQFRFHKMWLKHEGLRGVVEAHWANRVVGCPMFILASKLKGLKNILKVWNKEVFGNIHIRVKEAFKNLEDLQLRITNEGQSDTLMTQEDQAQKNLLGALISEEEFWKEKSRLNWKIRGDRNTAFFHNIAKIRYATKSMCILRQGEETLLHRQEIDNHVLSYFTNLYASENVTQPSNLIDYVIPKLVTQEDNNMLSRIPLDDEIRDAVFAMNGEGAPSPDGFGGCFFQEFWDIVGPDVCHSVNQFFTQASEAVNLLDHKTLGGNLALKLDVKKAFDTIDWRFLMDTLKALGFHNSFIHWIEVIFNSAKLSISVSGHNVGGIKRDLLAIKDLFNDYANVSSQYLNLTKCKFYSTQANARKIGKLTSWLGFGAGSLPFNYLGVPVFQGKPKAIHLQPIADRIINKLVKWKGCCLSIMGRVELVKTIIQSMLVYSFHIYTWPVNLLKKLDCGIRNFIWSGDTRVKKLVTVAWHKVCCPTKEGGLGLRSIKLLNEAAMLKLAWDMNSSQQEWATYYKNRFCRNKEPKSSYIKSSIWPGIRKHWQVILDNSIWVFGNGNSIRYWKDNWLGKTLVDLLGIPNQISSALLARILDFIHHSAWIIPSWLPRINPQVCQNILRTPIPATHLPDKLAWMHTNDGILSSKEAYNFTKSPQQLDIMCSDLWSSSIPPSRSFVAWRLHQNRMPTDENLKLRGMSMPSMCTLCSSSEESSHHLFFNCEFAKLIWNWLSNQVGYSIDHTFLKSILSISPHWSPQLKQVLLAAFVNSFVVIWFCRNKARWCVFGDFNVVRSVQRGRRFMVHSVEERLDCLTLGLVGYVSSFAGVDE